MVQPEPFESDYMTPEESAATGGFEVSAELIAYARQLMEGQDVDTVVSLFDSMHAADKAELFNQLSERERTQLTDMLAEVFDHTILPELSSEAAEDVIDALGVDKSVEALSQLETDDAVHIIEDLPEDSQLDILQAAPLPLRDEIEEGLAYPEDSAGRMMTKKLVCVPEFWSVGDAIDYMRAHQDLPEHFYVIYVVDARFHPIGQVPLGKIMQSARAAKIADITQYDHYRVFTDTDQEEVAHLFTKYALVETAVTNRAGRLVGTITVDDVVHVIHEEEGEDYLRSGGVRTQDIEASLVETVMQRFPWLFVNLLTAVLASVVIGLYAHTIEQLVALAVLMPMVASMGGNAGIQSVTVTVRALATRQLKSGKGLTTIRKELLIGLLNGLLLALVMAGGAWAWYRDVELALIFGAAVILTLLMAGFSGAAIPILLNRLKVDPAVSSGVFLTTVTDVVGFLSFLGLAALLLS